LVSGTCGFYEDCGLPPALERASLFLAARCRPCALRVSARGQFRMQEIESDQKQVEHFRNGRRNVPLQIFLCAGDRHLPAFILRMPLFPFGENRLYAYTASQQAKTLCGFAREWCPLQGSNVIPPGNCSHSPNPISSYLPICNLGTEAHGEQRWHVTGY